MGTILRKLIRPAMLILPLVLGVIFPQGRVLARPPYNFIRWALCLMIFINVLQIRFADLRPRKEHWKLLIANILLAVVPFFLLKMLFPASDIPAQAAFFTGITPTAAASAVIVSLLNGNTGFAVSGFIISNTAISCALLFLLPPVTGNFGVSFLVQVAESMVTVIFLPLAAARLVRGIFPGIMRYIGPLKNVSLMLWSASLYVIAGIAGGYLREENDASAGVLAGMAAIALVLCAVNFTAGYFLGKPSLGRESSQLLGQKNTTFAIFVALEYSSGIAALAPIFYVLFHNLWNSLQLFAFRRRQPERDPGEAETGKGEDPPAD